MNKQHPVREFMSAAMEYLFQSLQPTVIAKAEEQMRRAFPGGMPDPDNIITVHMRWGDKGAELQTLPAEAFVNGAQKMAQEAPRMRRPIHIYLASEDIDAINAFTRAAPSEWIIHTSGPTQMTDDKDMIAFRSGQNGMDSLAALLVSLQSNNYVLVTTSNWSRLINELRTSVIDPRCQRCTRMLDLHPGQWPKLKRNGQLSWGSYFGKPLSSSLASFSSCPRLRRALHLC
jgi:hypothetical protein